MTNTATTHLRAAAFLGALTLAGVAIAADTAGAHGVPKGEILPPVKQGLPAMLASFATFLIVLTILGKTVWPQIQKGLTDRENKIKEEIEAAEMARLQAKDALEQYQQSLAQARAEAQKMLEQAKAQQQAEIAQRKQQMDVELSELRAKAMADIEAARRGALNDMYSQAGQLATMAAGKILRREVNAGDQQRLIEESLSHLTSGRN